MKNCELCNGLARIYCESDHANLCWDCDLKVHSANFLVAKHSRSLLCNVCQSPTVWSATGAKIGRTVSVCERCVNDEETDREEEEEEEEEEIDLEDIQVVPWSSTPPPQPASSSSSSDESLTPIFSLKRMRDDDDSGTSTSHREVNMLSPAAKDHGGDEPAEFVKSFSMRMSSKIQRTGEILPGRVENIGCSATMELIGRINRGEDS
ncbi:B-box zinc finger protein 21-like [Solanum tuberosum]|uniref:B-box zinc finger protein 27 n=1 Tax=Solanum tuberosum TaxID=4113 RepID=M1B2S5_SOLTU|nr:PREDICTED: B-box zinc finger protein 21-like [Solanum tuberosum]ARU77866.1 B-box zinc finger protein 27 [Solanum tuberosum]